MTNKGITFIEFFIIIIIIGLMVAMAMPVYQKVKFTTIDNQYHKDPRVLTKEELEYHQEHIYLCIKDSKHVATVMNHSAETAPVVTATTFQPTNTKLFQYIVVDDKTYALVPRQAYPREIAIGDKIFWLVPTE